MVTDILAKDTDLYVSGDAGPAGARVRPRGARRRDPAAGRDEPQEAGRTKGACGVVNWVGVVSMALRKQKSRKQQVAELAVDYLKIKTATKAAKGAGKGAKKAAKGTAVYKVAKKTPIVKRIPGRSSAPAWPRSWRRRSSRAAAATRRPPDRCPR